MLAVTGVVTPVSPEYTSNEIAKSASTVTLTCFDTATSFSTVTCKFSGA